MILTTFCVFIFWCILACTFGYVEAYIWHLNATRLKPLTKAQNQGLHYFFTYQRFIGLLICQIPLVVVSYYTGDPYPWSFPLALFFIFPFFHSGSMFSKRHDLGAMAYERGWWSDPSVTSLARFNFSNMQRLTFFAVGLTIYILWLISV